MTIFNRKVLRSFFAIALASQLSASALADDTLIAKNTTSRKVKARKTTTRTTNRSSETKNSSVRSSSARNSGGHSDLATALNLAKRGEYQEASKRLFQLAVSPRFVDQRDQIKYILGLMLYQLDFNQLSAFQFISVIKRDNPKYVRQSLEKLSLAANELGDDTLLNYAISRVHVEEFPKAHRDMLYSRIGEYQLRAQDYAGAAATLEKVNRASSSFPKAKYNQALAYSEMEDVDKAINAFSDLVDSRASMGPTDSSRVAGIIGLARAYYQKKDWDHSVDYYRQVPRDTEAWHDSVFEMSWAMLRSGQFRSALSNFQTMHSSFYEEFYLPESLLLRSIVYLYICKYEEMEKVLNLYTKIYKPVYKTVKDYLDTVKSSTKYYADVEQIMNEFIEKGDEMDSSKFELPFVVARRLSKEGDYQRTRSYIKHLNEELTRIKTMSLDWQASSLGRYSTRVLLTRIDKAKKRAGRELRSHMVDIRNEMFDLFEQEGFIRYEMINGQKEALKKRVAGKGVPNKSVTQDTEKDYFVQNGYQYWPFQGEYWLDELGNYHYVGVQSCE